MRRLGSLAAAAVAVSLASGCAVAQGPATARPAAAEASPHHARDADHGGLFRQRPNVLLIEADDMRSDDLRFMPRTRAWFQERGLTFESSFSPNPLCCPARASLLTGRYSHNHEVLSHVEPFGFGSFDDQDTLATRLQDAGYRTALVGKYLNGYGIDPVPATGESSVTYVPPGWSEWLGSTDQSASPLNPYGGSTYDYEHLTSNVNGVLQSWPDQYTTDVTAAQTRNQVFGFEADRVEAGQDADQDAAYQDQPWFVWWTPVAPHHGDPDEADDPPDSLNRRGSYEHWLTPARPDWAKGRYDDVVSHAPGTPPRRPAEARRLDKPRYLRYLPYLTADERVALRDVTRQRAEALFALDTEIDKTMTMLDSRGLLRSTVVMFTSDNGFYLGEHLKREGKITPHEPSVRVPLLMTGAGIPHGRRYDPVSTVDLGPTIASWAGTTLDNPDGEDITALVRDGDEGWSRAIALEGLMGEPAYDPDLGTTAPLSYVGVRTARWMLVRYASGEREWYDLWTDPLQLSSRSARGVPPVIRVALERALRQTAHCSGDACRTPLPEVLREEPASVRSLVGHQVRAQQEYYGD